MCKYCKRLKELKDLEKKSYEEIIHYWRVRDLTARQLVADLVQLQVFDLDTQYSLLKKAKEFVSCNYVGK